MENILNNFCKLHLKALEENSCYELIINNINYEKEFRNDKSLEEIFHIFSGYTDKIKLSFDELLGYYYANNNKILTENDLDFIKKIRGIEKN